VATRAYGQYCGFARALEVVGERWAMLIIRDLLAGPKRFTDLQRGLPRIPSNILTARLKELEESGIVQRRALARSEGAGVAYELTAEGRELEGPMMALGRWGAKRLGERRPDEVLTEDSMQMALRSTFHPEYARDLKARYELRLGDVVVHACVADGKITVGKGALENADLVIEAGHGIRAVMAQELSPADAVKAKIVQLRGDRKLFTRFAEIFRI
jgi:DNA-binding HxlR family transcriptional regulator